MHNQIENENKTEWGNPRINLTDNRYNKNNKNNKPFKASPQNGNCCKHIYNTDAKSDFSVSSVKHERTENPGDSQYAEVSFKCKRKRLYKNLNNLKLEQYEYVIAQVENGLDIGTVCAIGPDAEEKLKLVYKGEDPEFIIVRHATQEDMDRMKKNKEDEKAVIEKTRELVEGFKLDMKVTDAEWQIDRQRLTIYFTAPQRIDFRELVKELARLFKTRIELRQISTREEAKRIGGMGPCGLDLCCSSFVNEFYHITLEHARTQQLSNNVSKLSGYCGRLKCCLLYEHNSYLEEYKNYPPLYSKVEHQEGPARIIKIDIFKKIITLQFCNNNHYRNLSTDEINELHKAGKIKAPEKDEVLQHMSYEDLDELAYLGEDVF